MGRKIKYMGTADNRVLPKGWDASGQLGEPLEKEVRWTVANNHLVDSEEAGLSEEALVILLDHDGEVFDAGPTVDDEEQTKKVIKEFKDVTDMKLIPTSLHQQIFRGMKSRTTEDDEGSEVVEATDEEDEAAAAEAKRVSESGKPARTSGSQAGGGGGPSPVGGSTAGAPTSGGRGGSTPGT